MKNLCIHPYLNSALLIHLYLFNFILGGYGCSAVLQEGRVFEKAGVNYTILASPAPKGMLKQMRARKPMGLKDDADYDMFVAGVSMVIHPHNPFCPTFHANYRYFLSFHSFQK